MATLHELFPKILNTRSQEVDDLFNTSCFSSKMFDVDVKETETKISIKADLPGFKKDQIRVVLDDFSITIKAYRSEEREESNEKFYKQERHYGQLERTIPLPDSVHSESSNAKYENGVLTIILKKKKPTSSNRKFISIE